MKKYINTIAIIIIAISTIKAQIRVVNTGAVGIGTTTPFSNSTLDVEGNVYIPYYKSFYMGQTTDAGNRLRLFNNGTDAYIDYCQNLHFRNGTNDAVLFSNIGTVGIGGSPTTDKLFVSGNTQILGNVGIGSTPTTDNLFVLGNTQIRGNVGVGGTPTTDKLFISGNTQITGNVGIGTNAPLTKLHINGDTYMPLGNSLWFNSTSDAGTRLRLFTARYDAYIDYCSNLYFRHGASGSLYSIIFQSNGSVAIGYSQGYVASSSLDVYGSVNVTGQVIAGGVALLSDSRFKDNVELNTKNSDKLKKLSSVKYDFKKSVTIPTANNGRILKSTVDTIKGLVDTTKSQSPIMYRFDSVATSHKHFGFIAQDIQKVFPEIVYADKQGYLSVDYISLIPILVGAFQEQSQIVDAQSTEIANQQNDISTLKQELSDLQTNLNSCCNTKTKLKSDIISNSGNDASVVTPDNSVLALYQNAPNPFKDNTKITMVIPQTVNKALLTVYDLTGK